MEGKIKWFNRMKGYGFIEGDDGQEYFIHHSQVAEGTFLREEDRVSFEAAETDKGKQAQNVVLLQKGSEIAKEEGTEEEPEAKEESEVNEEPEAKEESEVNEEPEAKEE